MPLFSRKSKDPEPAEGLDSEGKKKGAWKRPANTAFKQQRLKAWQPILTPKTVLPTLFLIGIIFAPIGGLLIWGSNKVTKITIDYTNCDTKASPTFSNVPNYNYDLRSSDRGLSITAPQWSFVNDSNSDISTQHHCRIRFNLPADLEPSVFLYYRLTNFFQNHRRYVKSLDKSQLKGNYRSASDLDGGNCKPLGKMRVNGTDKAIYPCGLIANSLFNDTFLPPILIGNSQNITYNFTDKGIAWYDLKKLYSNNPNLGNLSNVVPPPNWALRFPNGYTQNNIPKLQDDEHFQNWMRTAGLPTFTKLYFRNDHEVMSKGDYEISIFMNFPVTEFGGTKSIVLSTVSWVGGKNPFMGWAYVATACVFVSLGLAGTIRHLISPRKLGDMSKLSWNQPGMGAGSAR
ncbi:putative LEM3 /CDC50 family transcription regulatory protein [Cantharellus anzutake]|uniref:putative LEM3 /CDC50 family transcription regulatory protein n=1 Tax=Cantharellus anzutake TaxID=1750568 RepID=UPI001907BE80|nr:putative LEM3 /CDC50 family transcription regulatory protein [Cantharellus anzutake]KAF8321425.1 putative LEM3 /CDC50 family transcription regulatory protein [Cantharellus anzutake]